MFESERPDYEEVERIVNEELTSVLLTGYVDVGEEHTRMPDIFADVAESIKNLEVRDSDVIVASYPRSGTTWTQEMVWLIANDLDYEGAKASLPSRFPFLEDCGTMNYKNQHATTGRQLDESLYNSIEYVKNMQSPRFIKTHLPFSLLPDQVKNGKTNPKIIYIFRNPKDTCVSFYHFVTAFYASNTTLENFCEVFLAGKFIYGSYWKHLLGYWQRKHLPNLLLITYEDMQRDLPSVVRKVEKFLAKTLTETRLKELCDHLSFESMRANKAVNLEVVERNKVYFGTPKDACFIRSGITGRYKREMPKKMIEKFDAWIKSNVEGSKLFEQYDYVF